MGPGPARGPRWTRVPRGGGAPARRSGRVPSRRDGFRVPGRRRLGQGTGGLSRLCLSAGGEPCAAHEPLWALPGIGAALRLDLIGPMWRRPESVRVVRRVGGEARGAVAAI